jgi:hypothetical protein
MDRLPTAEGGLVHPFAAAGFHLRVQGDGDDRLHGAGKAHILAEAEHGLHASIRVRSKINAGQQFAAIGRRFFDCGGDALAVLAEGALLDKIIRRSLRPL